MLEWITSNIASIIITLVLAAVVAAIIVKLVKDKRKGRSNCAHCAMSNSCHKGKSE